jgi:hydrophobic/amphiphilic exporter-1 (mainly G- bacteria), HAE1 family
VKRLIALAVNRPVGTLMFFLGLIVLSIVAASGLGIEFLPEVAVPRLIIAASYPGLPAAEVRVLIAIPLEDALSSAKGIKRISSISREGIATLSLEFHWGSDMRMAAVEAREIIDLAYPALPSDTKKPLVLPADPDEDPVMIVGLFPKEGDLALARRLAEREIKTRLQQASGVGTVTLVGGIDEEIRVLVDQESMASRGLSLEELSSAIGSANYDYPAGTICEGGIEYLVKAKGSVDAAWKLGEFPVARPNGGSPFKVGDVATIRMVPKERKSSFCHNGRAGVALEIRKRSGVSPVDVSREVSLELATIRDSYGKDLDVIVERDSSGFVVESIDDLAIAVAVGAAIAFLLLFLFMRDLGICLIMISSVPVSMLAALLLLRLAGRTVNVMSLGGLAMGLGMMVDHSVVVVENLQRRFRLEGKKVEPNAVTAHTHELSSSNVGSTLTSVVVFIPVLLLPGIIGALFTDLSLAVIFSQVASFLSSITLVPVLFLFSSRREARRARTGREVFRGFERFERSFRSAFRFFFRRPLLLASAIFVLTAIGVVCFRLLPFEFLPDLDSGEVDVTMKVRQGSTMDYAAAAALDASRRVAATPGVAFAYALCGGEDEDPYYQASPLESREIVHIKAMLAARPRASAFDLVEDIRRVLSAEAAETVVNLPESAASRLLGGRKDRIELLVSGVDQAEAERRAEELRGRIASSAPGAPFSLSPSGLKPELRLTPDREVLAQSGMDLFAVAQTVKNAVDGSYPTKISSSGREIDVRVMLREDQRGSPGDLEAFVVRGASGAALPLGKLAKSAIVLERAALMRIDRRDALKAQLPKAAASTAAGEPGLRSLDESALAENIAPIFATFALVLLLLYLSLGAQFESFGLPFLLLLSLPLSISGIFGALFVTGNSINFDSILGIIVLFGVAVNNSVILYANFRKRGEHSEDGVPLVSIYRGTSERLRAVVITMSATILTMLPIALDFSRRTTQSSMAVAIIGGLLVSTTLTLFAVPMVFYRYLRGRP